MGRIFERSALGLQASKNEPITPTYGRNSGKTLLLRGLIECCATGVAQAPLVTTQTGRDCPHVRDLAGTQAIDVGGAGAPLRGCALILRKGCPAGEQRKEEAQHAALARTAREDWNSQVSRLHDRVSRIRLALARRFCYLQAILEINFAKCDFSHTWPHA